MEKGNSRQITTNQNGPHEKIEALVKRHLQHASQKPFNAHTVEAFEQANQWLADWQGPLILDSCCGVGESTAHIATLNPEAKVIGVDKSAVRTEKHEHYATQANNYCVVRADLNDFWRLAHQSGWKLSKHFLLYPNPYPKSAHVQRRWHASAAFADILALGGTLEVRSNWKIYIEEFALALNVAGQDAECVEYQAQDPQTPFERKYWASGQKSCRVVTAIG